MVKYRNPKTKPLSVLLFSLLSLAIMLATVYLAGLFTSFDYEGLLYTLSLACIAVPIHIFAKRNEYLYVVAWLLNSFGIGMAVSSYYSHSKIAPELSAMLLSVLPTALCLVLVCLLLYKFPNAKKLLLTVFGGILLLLVAASVVLWIINGAVIYSLSFFCLLEAVVWLFVCGITVGVPRRHILRDVSFGGFGIAIIVGVTVLTLVSEDGFGLELLEGAEIFDTKKKRK